MNLALGRGELLAVEERLAKGEGLGFVFHELFAHYVEEGVLASIRSLLRLRANQAWVLDEDRYQLPYFILRLVVKRSGQFFKKQILVRYLDCGFSYRSS